MNKVSAGKNIFIRTYDKEWEAPSNVLHEKLGFEIVDLHGAEFGNFPTKKLLAKKELSNSRNLLRHLKEFNHSNIVICSNYCALTLLMLRKLGILKCRKLLWYGVYIHNPKMFAMVHKFIHMMMPKSDFEFKIVVFSTPEIQLYAQAFELPESSFIYVPYGEWNKDKVLPEPSDKGYYFAGGYANRDFVTIAKFFQDKPWKVVIAASRKNEDFVAYTEQNKLSSNIEVHWDIPVEDFDRYLRECHALVMIMKYNTGASGQIVILHALENHKLVLASYTDVIDEYVQNEKTGIILKDKTQECFDAAMATIESPEMQAHYQELAENGYQHYMNTYSYKAISDYLAREIKKEL